MFVNLMRSNQRWLMILVSALAIISFVFFYSNRTQLDRSVSNQAGRIYGRNVTTDEMARIGREIQTAEDLRLYDFLDVLSGGGMDQGEMAINRFVLEHQAQAYGIEPTAEEVKDAEMKLPAFLGPNGQFDPTLYATFVDNKVTYRGFNETVIDDIVRQNLQYAKLKEIVEAGVVVTPADVKVAYEQRFSKTDASVVRFKTADFAAGVAEPTDDEVKKYYDEQKDHFQQPERRQVQYVKFALDDAQKKLTDRARLDALKPQADRAQDFLDQLEEQKGKADFAAVAAAAKVPVQETPEFEEAQTTGFPEAAVPGFAEAAFKLLPEDPNSDAPLPAPNPQRPDSYYDLHLVKVTPQRQLTLEEARPKIVKEIKDQRARDAMTAKAEDVRTKLADGLKAGHSFDDAAKDAGQTPQTVPPFSAVEPLRSLPDGPQIAESASDLGGGDLGKFVTTPDGGLLVYVRARQPVDEKKYDLQKDRITSAVRQQKASIVFNEWLRANREAADVQLNNGGVRVRG